MILQNKSFLCTFGLPYGRYTGTSRDVHGGRDLINNESNTSSIPVNSHL